MSEELLSVTDLMERYGKSETFIRHMIEKTNIPTVTLKKYTWGQMYEYKAISAEFLPAVELYIDTKKIMLKTEPKDKAPKLTLEEQRRLHPLVKDDRFFNLQYFPDMRLSDEK